MCIQNRGRKTNFYATNIEKIFYNHKIQYLQNKAQMANRSIIIFGSQCRHKNLMQSFNLNRYRTIQWCIFSIIINPIARKSSIKYGIDLKKIEICIKKLGLKIQPVDNLPQFQIHLQLHVGGKVQQVVRKMNFSAGSRSKNWLFQY